MNVLNRRVVAVIAALAALVVLAPVAQAAADSRCSNAIDPLSQCRPADRGMFNVPSPVEQPLGFPALLEIG